MMIKNFNKFNSLVAISHSLGFSHSYLVFNVPGISRFYSTSPLSPDDKSIVSAGEGLKVIDIKKDTKSYMFNI